ncbi:MAG: hypothetical protein ACRCXT_20845 [Paraclostridium sp.]
MENEIYCDECNENMEEGYIIYDGLYHYCSDKCLYKNINKKHYKYLHEQAFVFWTTFED